jgi:hypothetical protein
VLTTDVWVQKTSALLAQPEVRDTVSSMLTKQIFEQADVEAYVATVLPERISGLAGPLTNGLQTTVQGTVNTTLSSEAFADFWANANRSAHQGIMESIANNGAATPEIRQNNVIFLHDNQLVLNLKPVFVGLKDRLVGQGLSFLSGISGERISGQVALAELPQAHRIIAVVNILNRIVGLLPVIAAIAGAGAVALAVRKRRTLMAIGWVTIVLAVVVLQLIAFAQYPFMGALAAANTATSSAVFGIVIADLVTVFRTILILALLMVVAGFLTGSDTGSRTELLYGCYL